MIFINNINIDGIIAYFSETIDKFLILIFLILLISFKLTPACILIERYFIRYTKKIF